MEEEGKAMEVFHQMEEVGEAMEDCPQQMIIHQGEAEVEVVMKINQKKRHQGETKK
jgi:hypothetical protein